jgi:predicted nucleotidyltransferase/DNA-binding XRE family transcriptional regulator
MESFGEKIRKLREEKEIPLRTVAAYLDIDQAILSKIERGYRNANKIIVQQLADYFEVKFEELIVLWLSDKILYELEDQEDMAIKALRLAEERIAYKAFNKTDKAKIILHIREIMRNYKAVHKAWIFGSFARGDDKPKSDIDMAIETEKSFSYFDLAELKEKLESLLGRKVDIGFIDSFKPFILKNIKPDLNLIYEK